MKWVIIILLLSVFVSAQDIIASGNITLLALLENSTGKSGSAAQLSLELRPGQERVFLETFPMTKVTTQASLRFAQQIACRQLEIDCSRYDFLFTIRALPGIVGGPSAGGAATLLTASLLLNKTVPDDFAMTGTINSGGLVGPVGGLKQKIEAAAGNGIKTAFIPKGTKDVKEDDNKSIDLIEFGKSLNLTVREVATIDEVFEFALGIPRNISTEELRIEGRYKIIMQDVANDLCERHSSLISVPVKANLSQAKNFTDRAENDLSKGAYYAAASYCFRANVEYKRAWYLEQNFTVDELANRVDGLKKELEQFKSGVESRNISTLTDAQTFMVVMERVGEAGDLLDGIAKDLENNNTEVAGDVGFAEERVFSAVTWSRFFNGQDRVIVVDNDSLKQACASKISEAEERYNYVKSVIPEALDATRGDIDKASDDLRNGKFIMCLYGASKAKSEADVLLSLMGVEEKRFDEVIQLKLDIARQALMKAQHKNVFPIIAYSYYEYADSLRDFDRVSSLLFTEYSLELSNLDIYFEEKRPEKKPLPEFKLPSWALAFAIGAVLGGLFVWLIAKQVLPRLSSVSQFQTLQAPRKRRLRGKKR
jgi:uncharacterized protein